MTSVQITTGLVEDYGNEPVHQFVFAARNSLRSIGKVKPGVLREVYGVLLENSKSLITKNDVEEMNKILEAFELHILLLVSKMSLFSAQMRKRSTKAVKPSDIYREWAPTLRKIMSRKGTQWRDAQNALSELFLEQSLPASELENPDYIDAYTGEVQEEEQSVALSVSDIGKRLELFERGYEGKEIAMMVNQGGYAEFDWEETQEGEDRGFTPPTLIKDFEVDKELEATAYGAISKFNQARKEVFDWMKETGVSGQDWLNIYREKIIQREEFAAMINKIAEVAKESTVTAAIVWLKLATDYGITEDDVENVEVDEPSYSTLLDFVEDNEFELWELMNDGALRKTTEDEQWWKIAEFDGETVEKLAAKMPIYHHKAPMTRSWNMAYFNAITGGADIKQAEESAWNAWREAMSPKAAKAYSEVIRNNGTRSQAMSAFWKLCTSEVPRPKQRVVSIATENKTPAGLVLEGGRRINWTIAEIKYKNNELEFGGKKDKLAAKLKELNVGAKFLKAITA